MFFILSKIIGFFIYPIHFIFLLVLIYFILVRLKIPKIFSRIIFLLIVISTILGGSGYIASYLLWNLENKSPLILPNKANGIIMLGGSFDYINKSFKLNHVSLNGNAERIVEAYYLLKKYPDSKFLMLANSGFITPKGPSEANMAKLFFKKLNFDEKRLHIKPLANNTYQESIHISEYISKIGGNWILITSAAHMPRAINLFQSRKLNNAVIYTYPTDYKADQPALTFNFHLRNLNIYYNLIHEYLGMFAYKITGRTNKLWPDFELIPINHS